MANFAAVVVPAGAQFLEDAHDHPAVIILPADAEPPAPEQAGGVWGVVN